MRLEVSNFGSETGEVMKKILVVDDESANMTIKACLLTRNVSRMQKVYRHQNVVSLNNSSLEN